VSEDTGDEHITTAIVDPNGNGTSDEGGSIASDTIIESGTTITYPPNSSRSTSNAGLDLEGNSADAKPVGQVRPSSRNKITGKRTPDSQPQTTLDPGNAPRATAPTEERGSARKWIVWLLLPGWKQWCVRLGGLVLLFLAIPIIIWNAIRSDPTSGDVLERVAPSTQKKTKAGWITAATLFLGGCVAIGVTLSRGGNHGPDGSTISRTGNHGPDGPIINSTSETSTAPEPLWANITAARPCQPNFEGSALAVNGSHVQWGFWGISEGAQAVIVQVFNRSVSEFLVFFRGEPINMYHIQYVPYLPHAAACIVNPHLQNPKQQPSSH
jgi:hypothetical protein